LHFIAFNDIKSKHFSNALRYSSLYVISCIFNQSLKTWTRSASYMCTSFVDLLRGQCLNKAKSLLGFDWTCVGGHQKRVNIKTQS